MHSGVAAMPPSSTSSTAAMALRGAKKRKEGFTSPTLPAAVSPAPLGRPAAAGSRATVGVTPNTHGGAAALMSMGMLDTAATPRGLDAAAAIVAAAGAAALPTAAAAGGVVTGARQDGAAVGAFVAGAADEASEDGVGDFNCDQWRRQWMQEEDEALRGAAGDSEADTDWAMVAATVGTGRGPLQCLSRYKQITPAVTRRGAWTETEDATILACLRSGLTGWAEIASHTAGRNRKQCRERYHNHLNPERVRTAWTPEEDLRLAELRSEWGNKWSQIAKQIPGRSENDVKNRWNSKSRRVPVRAVTPGKAPSRCAAGAPLEAPDMTSPGDGARAVFDAAMRQMGIGSPPLAQMTNTFDPASRHPTKARLSSAMLPPQTAAATTPPAIAATEGSGFGSGSGSGFGSGSGAGTPTENSADEFTGDCFAAAAAPVAAAIAAAPGPASSMRRRTVGGALAKRQAASWSRSNSGAAAPDAAAPVSFDDSAIGRGADKGGRRRWATTGWGRWTAAEDDALRKGVEEFGPQSWGQIAMKYLNGRRTDRQCYHRWSKGLRPGLVKGPWTAEEDEIILEIRSRGVTSWSLIATHVPGRNGKQCRERWCNHLNPDIKKGPWSAEEDALLEEVHAELGSKWSLIAKRLNGRSENDVKNRWNCKLKRRSGASASGSRKRRAPAKSRKSAGAGAGAGAAAAKPPSAFKSKRVKSAATTDTAAMPMAPMMTVPHDYSMPAPGAMAMGPTLLAIPAGMTPQAFAASLLAGSMPAGTVFPVPTSSSMAPMAATSHPTWMGMYSVAPHQ